MFILFPGINGDENIQIIKISSTQLYSRYIPRQAITY